MVAGKMGGGRKSHGLTCPHCHGYHTTKEGAHEYFKARVNKKKLPFNTERLPQKLGVNKEYKSLPLDKFLKKYPEWKP